MGKKKRRYYAFYFMIAAEILAVLLTFTGFILRRTVVKGMPQYDGVQDIALPLMLIHDRDAIEEAKDREAWEEAHKNEPDKKDTEDKTTKPAETTTEKAEDTTGEEGASENESETESVTETETVTEEDVSKEPVEVDEHYFDNTLFIGDSKTDGMSLWGRLGDADYFCGTNFMVYNVFKKTVSNSDFKNATLDQVLNSKQYDQIYIILGYNESGYPYNGLMKQYTYVLERVMEAQPHARIILHAVMHASEKVAASHPEYTPETLNKISDGLKELADTYDGVWFIDCNDVFCDENGYLSMEYSTDGEHLTSQYTKVWAEEIMKRAITE